MTDPLDQTLDPSPAADRSSAAPRARYVPPPYQDGAESGRIILRDGSTAMIRVAQPADAPRLRELFQQLSPESRSRRFFSANMPDEAAIADLCDPRRADEQLTLVVLRTVRGTSRVIATGSYFRQGPESAEVAFAVLDEFQGLGLGTVLLERLALLAIGRGITRFSAVTQAENRTMIDIFRHSGFELREQREDGYLLVHFSVEPTEASVARTELVDRLFTAASLRPFFRPKAVAVVGASREASSIGYRILEALVMNRFNGPVYPVNPKSPVVGSIRAYPSVRDLPDPVDLAIIVVPRDFVLPVVDDCAARGVRALVVISAGFAETGAEGAELQRRLVEKVRAHGMRMIGPNCLGVINAEPDVRLNASFSPVYPPAGHVAMSSQSGALGIAILALAQRMQLGLSHFVSIGNKADVSGNDLLQFWEQDPSTRVVLLYLESFGNPRRFSRIARRVSRAKPIVAVKSGRTVAGRLAAGSHTAALAASDEAVEALFRQTGVIRAETLSEMFALAATLANQPLPSGKRVAIVTNAGGPGILCADACETGGLQVVKLSDEIRARLAAFLPPSASLTNPVDMIASATPEQFQRAIATVLASDEVDALIAIYIPVGVVASEAVVQGIAAGVKQARQAGATQKPVLSCLMADDSAASALAVGEERIPAYLFPEEAAGVLSKVAAYADWRRQPEGVLLEFADATPEAAREICRRASEARGDGWLSVEETWAVLEAMRLPVTPAAVVGSAEEAVKAARTMGVPVAMKVASRQLLHKSDVGAVLLNVADEHGVREGFATLMSRVQGVEIDGIAIQPMQRGGVEVMIGTAEDPAFGPLIAFGLGGIHVEILRDVVFRLAPLTDRDAAQMVQGIRGVKLLRGYRGHPAADLAALETTLLRVSLLVEEVPEITELDLNPLFALPPGQGCRIVDARIRVARARQPVPTRVG